MTGAWAAIIIGCLIALLIIAVDQFLKDKL